jgi:hypothetical protein
MSELDREILSQLQKTGVGLTWFQRASIIVFANVFGLVLGAIVIAAGGIVWNKAMSTDTIKAQITEVGKTLREEMEAKEKLAVAERAAVLAEVSRMKAENERIAKLIGAAPASTAPEAAPIPAMPESVSADDVEKAKSQIQQQIDKSVYRAKMRE